MSWNFEESNGEKKNFTKFPEGITFITVLDDEPHIRWQHWMNQFNKGINCPGRGCPIDELRRQQKSAGEKQSYNAARRFAINVWNHETKRVEILEQGKTFFEDMRDHMEDLKKDGKKLSDVRLKVKRRGTGKDDTSYRIDIDSTHTEEEIKEMQAVEKTDLHEYFQVPTNEQIVSLLQVKGSTKEEFAEAWASIMTPKEEPQEEDEPIEVK